MKTAFCAIVAAIGLATFSLSAATLYVSLDGMNPTPPFATWATAATNIQDAVDAAADGDTVLVTNGVYRTGGRTAGITLVANRVVIQKSIQLQSVNGAAVTTIEGAASASGDPSGNGAGAVRCVYLSGSNATVTGFTLTKGHTLNNGDWETDQAGGGMWCGSASALILNCVLTGNSGGWGGGTHGGTFQNCTFTGNSAGMYGGAADGYTLEPCNLINCIVSGNSTSTGAGGGVSSSALNNCTVTGNSAETGGGTFNCHLNNCILYYNQAQTGDNSWEDSLNYCCTEPLPSNGIGNISLDPQLTCPSHLSSGSPCRGAGSPIYTSGVDVDGESWANPPSIGCDEYYEGAVTGPLTVDIVTSFTNVAVGSTVAFTASITGRTTDSVWDFGDGVILSNRPYASHTWSAPGIYNVILRAYNESLPDGESSSVTVYVTAAPFHYVAADSVTPVAPYTSWATAATNIQDAVDVASPGAVILVTNGVYQQGSRAVLGTMTNRVAVDKQLTLESVNGPEFTVIRGFQVPGSTNGDGAVRCVYLASGATLSGFTLRDGATLKSAGDWYGAESGGGAWCQGLDATLSNCIVVGNSASYAGGGVFRGTLQNCILSGNSAVGDNGSRNSVGGGAYGATLFSCTVTGNCAQGEYGSGGGVVLGTLVNCTISGNSAISDGGGVYYGCTLTNCILVGNSAGGYGGGAEGENAEFTTLYNCLLSGNSAGSGGGAAGSHLYNCTLTGNSVDHLSGGFAYSGGGVSFSDLINCIVYYNTAVWGTANYDPASTLTNCCTTPLPATGSGNIDLEPQLASIKNLSATSPCRGAGLVGAAVGTDLDGEPWANPPSIGCDEYYAGGVTGPLNVAILAPLTNIAAGAQVPFTAVIHGRAAASVWDFGDGVIISNRPYASHAWAAPGDYLVTLRVYNDSQPSGVAATVAVNVAAQLTHYVAANSTNPVPPFISWTTAAMSIQDAVDVATAGDEIVVADGLYATGGRAVGANLSMNRVAVTNRVTLRSVNGPQSTLIQGAKGFSGTNIDDAVRCVYLANGASLFGFTLTNGATLLSGNLEDDQAGGGVWCESTDATLSNCVLVANSAGFGGGAYRGTLYNCLVSSNSVIGDANGGGGACQSTLYNCNITGNSASSAYGGVSRSTLYNCIVYYNLAPFGENYDWPSSLNYCCTTPTPTNGIGNKPLFVDYNSGNQHLQSNSPCINAGNNAFVAAGKDFDGKPRIVGGTVDIGAYEFQGSNSVISYAWLQQYGLPTDGSADFIDSDNDGMNNWQEWVCGTDPTNAQSALRMLSAVPTGTNATVTWESVAGVSYFLQVTTNHDSPFTLLATNIAGQAGTTSYADTNAIGGGPFFYRVGVPLPTR
jgi:PKD repeat protein